MRSLWGAISGLRRSLLQIFLMAAALEALALLFLLFTQWIIDDVLVANDHDLLDVFVIGFLGIAVIKQIVSVSRYRAVMYYNAWRTVEGESILTSPQTSDFLLRASASWRNYLSLQLS